MKNAYELFAEGKRTENRSFLWTLIFIIQIVGLLYFRDFIHSYVDMHTMTNTMLFATYIMLPMFPAMHLMTEGKWTKDKALRNYGYDTEEHF
jgi:hypothetical protein